MSRERELLVEILECFRGVWSHSPEGRKYLQKCDAILAQPEAEPAPAAGKTPFPECKYTVCDLPGQCVSEGKCHHQDIAKQLRAENERLRKELEERK